jgi:hypothetical protein
MNLGQRRSRALTVTVLKRRAGGFAAAERPRDRRARLPRPDRRNLEERSGACSAATRPEPIAIAQDQIAPGK